MTPGMVGYSADNVRQHIGFISNKLTNQFQDGEHVIGVVLSGYFKIYWPIQNIQSSTIDRGAEAIKISWYGRMRMNTSVIYQLDNNKGL